MTDDDFDEILPPELRSAHVIVVGNEKGGTGKSTLSIHLSVALMKAGFRVATIDLDTRQQTLTRFFENRTSWAQSAPWDVELPHHFALERGTSDNVRDNETREFAAFAEAISEVEHTYEFVVIDTPASDSYLMRLAHSLADTLVSAGQRFLHRRRRLLARASRPHQAWRRGALRRSGDRRAAQAPPGRPGA